jgi:hypothetical protein
MNEETMFFMFFEKVFQSEPKPALAGFGFSGVYIVVKVF